MGFRCSGIRASASLRYLWGNLANTLCGGWHLNSEKLPIHFMVKIIAKIPVRHFIWWGLFRQWGPCWPGVCHIGSTMIGWTTNSLSAVHATFRFDNIHISYKISEALWEAFRDKCFPKVCNLRTNFPDKNHINGKKRNIKFTHKKISWSKL